MTAQSTTAQSTTAQSTTAQSATAPERLETHAIGASLTRLDGPAKVTGSARYAFEHPVPEPLYLYPLQATIAAGRVTSIDTGAAMTEVGVLAVLTHHNALRVASTDDPELAILQSDRVDFRAQLLGGVIVESSETPGTPPAWWTSLTSQARTMPSCGPTATTSTPPSSSTPVSPPTPLRVTSIRLWRQPPRWWTRCTPPPCITTTRWSPTPRWPSGQTTGSPCTTPPRGCTRCARQSPPCWVSIPTRSG